METLYPDYTVVNWRENPPNLKEPLPLSIFLILPFLIGSIAVSALPGYNKLVIGLGVICGIVFLMASVRDGFFVPTELKLFAAFILWSTLGIAFAQVMLLATYRFRTLIQLVIMALIITYYARNVRCVSWLFLGVLGAVLLIAAAAVYTGEYKRAEVEGDEARLAGLVMNANSFAIAMTYGTAILLYFFRQTRSLAIKGVIILVVLAAVRFIIASGSRKGFLALAILLLCWFLLNYGKELLRRPALGLIMLIGIIGMGVYMVYELRDTVLMERLLRLKGEAGLQGRTETGVRMVMLREGVEMTLSNPLAGVGLDNFRVHSVTSKYAHNNYIELFSTTGIPGGILYYLIYFLILRRIFKLRKMPLKPEQCNVLAIFLCLMVVILFLDIGIVSYYLKTTWILLAIMIGYTNMLQRQLTTESLLARDEQYAYDQAAVNQYY